MSTNIATSWIRDFQRLDDSGSSFTSVTDDKVIIETSTTGSGDRAYIYKRLPSFPGEVIKVTFRARVDSGNMAASIDFPALGTSVISKEISVSGWNTYSLTYTTPDTSSASDYYQITIGQYTGYAGVCEIADVQISVENSKLPTLRAYAGCLLEIASGSVSLNTNFTNVGIDESVIDALGSITSSLTLTIPATGGNNQQAAPIFYASMTNDSAAFYKVMVKVGGYNRTTGTVTITFIDSTTGSAIDISSLGTNYLWVLAFGV